MSSLTPSEMRLKCLELAMVQARAEGKHGEIEHVAEITTRFYNLCVEEPAAPKSQEPEPEPRKKTTRADKAPEIFK